MTTAHNPIHPGEILLEECLTPLGTSQYQFAHTVACAFIRVHGQTVGNSRVTPDESRGVFPSVLDKFRACRDYVGVHLRGGETTVQRRLN